MGELTERAFSKLLHSGIIRNFREPNGIRMGNSGEFPGPKRDEVRSCGLRVLPCQFDVSLSLEKPDKKEQRARTTCAAPRCRGGAVRDEHEPIVDATYDCDADVFLQPVRASSITLTSLKAQSLVRKRIRWRDAHASGHQIVNVHVPVAIRSRKWKSRSGTASGPCQRHLG